MRAPGLQRALAGIQIAGVAAYILVAGIASHEREHAFDQVTIGQSEAQVRVLFGHAEPVRTGPRGDAARLTAPACASCDHRYWFENRMSLDIEAWIVDFDRQGHVLAKVRWYRWMLAPTPN